MKPPPHDDPLDALLRAAPPALPDAGFSQRVLAALPPPAPPARFARLRPWALAAGTFAGCMVTSSALGAAHPSGSLLSALLSAFAQITRSVTEPAVLVALAVAVGSLLGVFYHELRRLLA